MAFKHASALVGLNIQLVFLGGFAHIFKYRILNVCNARTTATLKTHTQTESDLYNGILFERNNLACVHLQHGIKSKWFDYGWINRNRQVRSVLIFFFSSTFRSYSILEIRWNLLRAYGIWLTLHHLTFQCASA